MHQNDVYTKKYCEMKKIHNKMASTVYEYNYYANYLMQKDLFK